MNISENLPKLVHIGEEDKLFADAPLIILDTSFILDLWFKRQLWAQLATEEVNSTFPDYNVVILPDVLAELYAIVDKKRRDSNNIPLVLQPQDLDLDISTLRLTVNYKDKPGLADKIQKIWKTKSPTYHKWEHTGRVGSPPVMSAADLEILTLGLYRATMGKYTYLATADIRDIAITAQSIETTEWHPIFTFTPQPPNQRNKHELKKIDLIIPDQIFGRLLSANDGEYIRVAPLEIFDGRKIQTAYDIVTTKPRDGPSIRIAVEENESDEERTNTLARGEYAVMTVRDRLPPALWNYRNYRLGSGQLYLPGGNQPKRNLRSTLKEGNIDATPTNLKSIKQNGLWLSTDLRYSRVSEDYVEQKVPIFAASVAQLMSKGLTQTPSGT